MRNFFFEIKNSKWLWVALFLLAVHLYLSIALLGKYPAAYGDEALYAEPCYNFLTSRQFNTNLYPPVGGFDHSNLIHGRVFNFIQVFFIHFFGVSIESIRLQPLLFSYLLLFLTGCLSYLLFSSVALALWSVVLLAFSHMFFFLSHFGRPDMTAAAFFLSSQVLFLLAMKKSKNLLFFLAGVLAALAVDCHPPAGATAMAVLFGLSSFYWWRRQMGGGAWVATNAGIAVGVFSWIAVHILPDPDLFFLQRSFIRVCSTRTEWTGVQQILLGEYQRWYSFFWEGFLHRNMFLLGLLLLGFWKIFWSEKNLRNYFLVFLTFAWIGLAWGAPNKTTWYILYLYPWMAFMMLYGIFKIWQDQSKAFAVGLMVLLTLFLGIEQRERLKFWNNDFHAYSQKLRSFLPSDVKVLASDQNWIALYDYVSVFPGHYLLLSPRFALAGLDKSFYTDDLALLLKRNQVQYVVVDPELVGWTFNQKRIPELLDRYGEKIGEFDEPFTGFSNYLAKKSAEPLKIQVYKLNFDQS